MPQQVQRVQLAQAATGHEAPTGPGAAPHSGQEHAGHHVYRLGDIPDPWLLFSNGILVALVLAALGFAMARRLARIPRGWQSLGEFVVESFVNFNRGIIGPGSERHVPLVGTLFLFIYLGNLWGLLPGMHSPTANLSTNLALGLIVFFYVQFVGIRQRGIRGYLGHFWGPIPAAGILLFPIEVISELVKPFTLALRLFGNIFGEDTVIIVLATLGILLLPQVPVVALHFPVLVLALLTTFVQALVFTLLTAIYIALQSHHEEEHGESAHGTALSHAEGAPV
ncbi:MAG: F0F1 ATP synthase subunit A [Chthonomonadales bacterium]|nr:F0F1 ATP synthase subunit A [Chthonomonadales bacterium]